MEWLVRRMLGRYPDVARWEGVEDVLQGAYQRLWTALRVVTPTSTRSFANLAAQLIQRELIDLARHYRGPRWVGASRESDGDDRARSRLDVAAPADPDLDSWATYHEAVARLPDDVREVFTLTMYGGLSRAEIAAQFDVDMRTIQRRLAAAVARLQAELGPECPPR